MVTHIKELSEDEKIRQQCAARADYESRLVSQFNQGIQQGQIDIIHRLLNSGMTVEEIAKICDMTVEEAKKRLKN